MNDVIVHRLNPILCRSESRYIGTKNLERETVNMSPRLTYGVMVSSLS